MDKAVYHRLQRGETLEALSARYGIPACMIMRANTGARFSLGQMLVIPRQCGDCRIEKQEPPRVVPNFRYAEYIIQPDDTLYGISRRTGLTMRILQKANALSGVAELQPGERLRIPAFTGKRYYVREGESISEIAAEQHVSEAALREKNFIEDGETIGPGACLLI